MPRASDDAAVDGEWDFDARTAERRLEPQPLKLGGRVYHLRRDLTARERNDATRHITQPGSDGDVECAAILLGKPGKDGSYATGEAEKFVAAAAALPHDVETEVWEKVLVAARLATPKDGEREDGDAGESPASSPA